MSAGALAVWVKQMREQSGWPPTDIALMDTIDKVLAEHKALREALDAAIEPLERLVDIIEGHHYAQLVSPHGQSSQAPQRALDLAKVARRGLNQ